jgi:hypothetical protein
MSIEEPDSADLAEAYRKGLEAMTSAMGADFTSRYVASLEVRAGASGN